MTQPLKPAAGRPGKLQQLKSAVPPRGVFALPGVRYLVDDWVNY